VVLFLNYIREVLIFNVGQEIDCIDEDIVWSLQAHIWVVFQKRPRMLYVMSLPVHYWLIYSAVKTPFKSGYFEVPYNFKHVTFCSCLFNMINFRYGYFVIWSCITAFWLMTLNNMKYIKTSIVLNVMLWQFRHSDAKSGECYSSPSLVISGCHFLLLWLEVCIFSPLFLTCVLYICTHQGVKMT
jgi:hypothetical protein